MQRDAENAQAPGGNRADARLRCAYGVDSARGNLEACLPRHYDHAISLPSAARTWCCAFLLVYLVNSEQTEHRRGKYYAGHRWVKRRAGAASFG